MRTALLVSALSYLRMTVGLGCAIAVLTTEAVDAQPHAHALLIHSSRSINMTEYANLHLTSESGATLRERGSGWGTFNGPIVASLAINPSNVIGTFTISPRGGSVTGRARARFTIRGGTGYYGGTLTIIHGSGIYRHANGSNIGISGTINRQTFALTVKAHGRIKY